MYGRLGNQFFRYAVARALQLQYYPTEQIMINFSQINELHKKDPSFYNVLNDYQIKDYAIYEKQGSVLFKETGLFQKIICAMYYSRLRKFQSTDLLGMVKLEEKWRERLDRWGVYWYRYGCWDLGKSTQRDKFVSGCFEDPAYFNNYRDVLLKELTPKHERLSKNATLYKIIESTQSICVSVRRGDFENNSSIKSLHSVCNQDYFMKAISEIKKRIKSPVFVLFSDDIEWAKENIQTGTSTYYEDGTDPVWEKLRMMSLCKHFIISNSTFSWWSQYLSTNPDKIVVSPSRWFNNDYKSHLIEDSFIKVNV